MVKRKRSIPTLRSTESPTGHDVELRTALNSRTLKRVRDGRPSDDEVHQRTLAILYSAQQREQHSVQESEMQITTMNTTTTTTPPPPDADHDRQRTLHRYWNIASSPSSCASSSPPQLDRSMKRIELCCVDCGAGLTDKAGETTMQPACLACGKHVCLGCSYSQLGENRHCLQCVGGACSNDTSVMVF
ncbi:hypothetical protein L249_7796 [Ophiocordyceps polyrhachis-furcata BCC 54312]|uniref:Uncharacterized protein n=1 Tax=Ophiocordyceps polyrhachis-furcata BCC 54312 TaxID=1330021 RepID=A0A367L0P6_9HYPO|nr:hypothetical protein L249_7796 [Ophiocordyceps polyrhachis-furcata BCC 54312]